LGSASLAFRIFAAVAKTSKPNSATLKKASGRKKSSGSKKASRFSLGLRMLTVGFLLILLSPFYYGYVLKGFTAAWQRLSDRGGVPGYHTYQNFGIRIPGRFAIHGIDVSSYQGKIDWSKVKAMEEDGIRIKFAFIKATEGLLHVDRYFSRNWREAPKAGITCGAYHYFKPKKDGKLQARFFLQTVKFEKGDLPPAVDIEELSGTSAATMRKELKAFLRYVESKTGVKPIIYSGLVFYKDYLQNHFNDYPLWIAHYHKPELRVSAETKWKFWQHADNATVSGTAYDTDMNVFNGDSSSFQSLLIK
jgi:lysozyme